jgi:hypothetical protein
MGFPEANQKIALPPAKTHEDPRQNLLEKRSAGKR